MSGSISQSTLIILQGIPTIFKYPLLMNTKANICSKDEKNCSENETDRDTNNVPH